MPDIRLIALDLDGTLLNTRKKLSPRNRAALCAAAQRGIEIVPCTGRFFGGMPEEIRQLPFLHYAITINGAQVYDVRRDKTIAHAEIPCCRAVEIMSYLDRLPVIYDCYMDNWGWMSRGMWEKAEEYAPDAHYAEMIRKLRQPVEELKRYLSERGGSVQKIQFFCKEEAVRRQLLETLPELLADIAVSTSAPNNVELNHKEAHKGHALLQLARYLCLTDAQTMAFGDGINDLSLLRLAGLSIAMGNAEPEVKRAACEITADCDHDGVALCIEKYCLQTARNNKDSSY